MRIDRGKKTTTRSGNQRTPSNCVGVINSPASDDDALYRLWLLVLEERKTDRVLKDLADALACPRGAVSRYCFAPILCATFSP